MTKFYEREDLREIIKTKTYLISCTCSELPIRPPATPDQVPVSWWNPACCDKSLLVGTYKHGCEMYRQMRADPTLCFVGHVGAGEDLAVTNLPIIEDDANSKHEDADEVDDDGTTTKDSDSTKLTSGDGKDPLDPDRPSSSGKSNSKDKIQTNLAKSETVAAADDGEAAAAVDGTKLTTSTTTTTTNTTTTTTTITPSTVSADDKSESVTAHVNSADEKIKENEKEEVEEEIAEIVTTVVATVSGEAEAASAMETVVTAVELNKSDETTIGSSSSEQKTATTTTSAADGTSAGSPTTVTSSSASPPSITATTSSSPLTVCGAIDGTVEAAAAATTSNASQCSPSSTTCISTNTTTTTTTTTTITNTCTTTNNTTSTNTTTITTIPNTIKSNNNNNNHNNSTNEQTQNETLNSNSCLGLDEEESGAGSYPPTNLTIDDATVWPSMQDLNTRLRRVITAYQRNYKKEELKLQQKAKVSLQLTRN